MSKHDISKLTREQKYELIKLLEEKERRQQDSSTSYVPHSGQLRVHMSEMPERWVTSGNAYGKSALLTNEVHWAAVGYNPIKKKYTKVPAKIALVLDSPEKVDDFLLEYRKWHKVDPDQLHKKGKPNYSLITYSNGSTVQVLTHLVEPLRLEGSQFTHLFFDEPMPKAVFTALYRGVRQKGIPIQVLACGTPISQSWIRMQIYEPWARGELKDVECFRGDSSENAANLADGYLEKFSSKLSEREREVRLRGAFHDLSGLALSHLFDREKHIIYRDQQEDIEIVSSVVAIDPHPSKKSYACLMGVDRDNRLYIVKEMAIKATARDFARELHVFMRDHRVIDIVCDSLGSAQMTSGEGFKSWIEVLNEEGIRCRATTYKEKNDEEWISRIQDALLVPEKPDTFGQCVPKLRIFEQCKNSISDIENVQWVHDKRTEESKPTLDISNKDALSCIKYALSTNLSATKNKDKAFYLSKPLYGFQGNAQRKQAAKTLYPVVKPRYAPRSGRKPESDW